MCEVYLAQQHVGVQVLRRFFPRHPMDALSSGKNAELKSTKHKATAVETAVVYKVTSVGGGYQSSRLGHQSEKVPASVLVRKCLVKMDAKHHVKLQMIQTNKQEELL